MVHQVNALKFWISILLFGGIIILCCSFFYTQPYNSYKFPYQKAGLTEREAAAHLLSRFTYGATPAQVNEVMSQGLEKWFQLQLNGSLPDDSLNQRLSKYDALKLSNAEICAAYPKPGEVLRMAIKDSVVNKDSVKSDRKAYREVLQQYMQQKGYKPGQELIRQFINQKILRAAYSNNQLQEVMTDFWFNHFNVSFVKRDCAQFIPDYERDVIRPNALGKFSSLLLATAKSPAMLYYLDNFSSAAPKVNSTSNKTLRKQNRDINENYAREVMELHTLGVDGGYTQKDVTQAARVLTGWTVYPMSINASQNPLTQLTPEQLQRRGFVHDGDFLFNPNKHDGGIDTVMGRQFGPDGGYQEGVDLLNMLAHRTSTAQFISRKIAVRFVSDNPPQSLINKMARTFEAQDGDIKQVLITMVSAPEFWSSEAIRQKTKSPFELAIGTVRSLNATITQPYQLYNWIARMGEKKYYYQAPTGFPDKGQYWINTGSLLTRMNFGLAIAAGRIPGVKVDLAALNHHHEPESAQQALITYGNLIMPERNLDATIKRLTPLLNDPELTAKINAANVNTPPNNDTLQGNGRKRFAALQTSRGDNSMLAQVAGVIIGSPEYQRR